MSYRRTYYPTGYRPRGMGMALPPEDRVPEEETPAEIVPIENGAREISLEEPAEQEEITTETWMFSSTVAQQIFSIVPGVAGGLAGFILALKLAGTTKVKASEVLLAAGLVALVTFSVVFVVRTVEE